MEQTAKEMGIIVVGSKRGRVPMPKPNDLSKSPVAFDESVTLIAVIEMSQGSWLVAGPQRRDTLVPLWRTFNCPARFNPAS
ncbi:hypothetical protein ACVWXM_009938 [Bradyrhizobium sp. GM7.3]